MINSDSGLFWPLIAASLIFSLLLTLLPMPYMVASLRPEFICLVAIFWVSRAPLYVGVGFTFMVGLAQSVIELSVWGSHALALCLCTYFVLRFERRLLAANLWQQCLYLAPLLLLHQLLVGWLQSVAGYSFSWPAALASALTSILLWPFVCVLLGKLCRIYHVV